MIRFNFSKTMNVGTFRIKAFYNGESWWYLLSVFPQGDRGWPPQDIALRGGFMSKNEALENGLCLISGILKEKAEQGRLK